MSEAGSGIAKGLWQMQGRVGQAWQTAARWIVVQLRRSELIVFLPAITLVCYWTNGVQGLVVGALGLPLLSLGARAIGMSSSSPQETALSVRLIAPLDKIMREAPITGRATACLVIAVDEMEELLLRHGANAQTEILVQAAERLKAVLREGDLVAPLEGGSFAVALAAVRRLDLETVVQLAGRLQQSLSDPFSVDAARIYVTASVGFCLSQRAPRPMGSSLFDAARMAAVEARYCGPSAIRAYSPEMARNRIERDQMRDELEQALDEGQIRAHFQPQISTDTGGISGFEALARWYHPSRGIISPAEFLPGLEAAGLAERLGEVMLYNALSALIGWDRAGFSVPHVSVNFSAAELGNPRLAEKLKWELDRFELDPKRLCIEVLETVIAATDNDVIVSNLVALSKLGCSIDLDDFGTGHASITSIRRFPVRRLKIDRSFVTRVDEDRDQQKIVGGILSLAERMGLETLAEGVETPGEHAMLAQLGCAEVQGFGIARPMPLDEATTWITRHHARKSVIPRIGSKAR